MPGLLIVASCAAMGWFGSLVVFFGTPFPAMGRISLQVTDSAREIGMSFAVIGATLGVVIAVLMWGGRLMSGKKGVAECAM